jgi:CBS domain-containing protein
MLCVQKARKEDGMAYSVRDVMTTHPITLPATSSVVDAARAMRDAHIGDIIVVDKGLLCGIVTDRDIIVRGIAEGRDLSRLQLGDICSRELTTLFPTDSVDDAVRIMREKAIRRLPVVEDGAPVGIVSIGDLAVKQDRHSTLGTISAAPPNR